MATAVDGTFNYLADDVLGTDAVAFDSTGAPIASRLYTPYGAVRYANGAMPDSFGFTGQREDAATGLDYYGFRYYDPSAGQFISPDSTLSQNGADLWGLSRYAYVEGNPATKKDPDGHCFPICTMIAGALVGAAVGAVASIATQAASGSCCDWGTVGKEAAVGAVSGAISGLVGPAGGVVAQTIVGAAAGAAGQVVSNALNHKPLGDGVLLAAGVGAVTGGVTGGIARGLAILKAPRLAGQRAAELGQRITPMWWQKKAATIVTAHLEDGTGAIQKFVTVNETGWSKGFGTTVRAALKRGEGWIEPWATAGGRAHGEDYVLAYAQRNGLKLRGIGASNLICGGCEGNITRAWGYRVIGSRVSPRTGTGFIPYWMRSARHWWN